MKKTTNKVKRIFAQRLDEIMKFRGKNQKDLASDIGVSPQTISYYVNDDRLPDVEILCKIAQALDVSADYLLGITKVISQDVNIKDIHEKLGLSEYVIQTLMFEMEVLKQKTKGKTFDGRIQAVKNNIDYIRSASLYDEAVSDKEFKAKLEELGINTKPSGSESINVRFNTWIAYSYCGCAHTINKLIDEKIDMNENSIIRALGNIVNYIKGKENALLLYSQGNTNGKVDFIKKDDVFLLQLLRLQQAFTLRQQRIDNKKQGGGQ